MMKNIKSVGVLVAICTVVALLLAVTNQFTAPIIANNQAANANKALLEVMPDGTGFELMDLSGKTLPATVTEAYKETSGKGYVIQLSTTGYGPNMVIMCGVSADGKITGAVCLSSNETLGKEKEYGANFTGKDAAAVEATDTIGGATMTTGAYKNAVKDALNTALILGGGEADLRSPEEIFNDNLAAALPAADEFVKQAVADSNHNIGYIYAAKNGAGYVFVIREETFVGVDADGNVITTGITDESAALAKEMARLAASQTKVDTTDSGINENITAVQKTAEGNYLIEINGLGFAYFGDPSHYMPAKDIPIQICVVISPEGKMLKCLTVAHQESPNYGAVCGEESYYSQFDGKTVDTYKEADGIAGATITTSGYMKAIERCFKAVEILEGGAK